MARFDPTDLPEGVASFLAERHLATLSIPRPGAAPHVTPVGFTWDADAGLARVITFAASVKYQLIEAAPVDVTLCQVDGGRWLTLQGRAVGTSDPQRCAEAMRLYGERYRDPKQRPDRVAIEISVDTVLGRA